MNSDDIRHKAAITYNDADKTDAMLRDTICKAADRITELEREVELHRMQMAGMMTASMQNTETSIKDRISRENPYWCQGYEDVCRAVDREMKLRAERDELAAWKESALLVESRWDCQRVAKLLGIGLGQDIRPNIEPKIRELLEDKATALAAQNDGFRAVFADPVPLRTMILRHGPPGFDLYSAEHIERIKSEAVHQVEQKLNDALVENAHLKEAFANGDCKDPAADNEILRAELRRLLVDECVSRSDADRIADALKAIE